MFKQTSVFLTILALTFILAGCGKSAPTSPSPALISNESSLPAEVQEFTNEMSKMYASAASNSTTVHYVKYVVNSASTTTTATAIYYVEGNSWKYERITANYWEKEVVITTPGFFLYAAGSANTYRTLSLYNNGVHDSSSSGDGSFQFLQGLLQ
ncbi:hypothetical protein KAR34_13955 [bacterium]|nr:hypothetical protein [bacterium]